MHPNFKAPYQNIFECTPFSETHSLAKADFIYLNTPYFEGRDQEHPAVFEEELKQISQTHLPVICPNPDYFAQHGQPPVFMVRQGILAARLQKMGVDVRYIGKPEEAVFTYACEKLREFKKDLSRIVIVGDNPQTDIRGAKKVNLDSALLVETGILSHLYPQYSLQELDQVLSWDEKPTYFLKRL
jgi:ribonucleotide monophosphatase NagD (HAD superfamily)